MEKKEGPTTKEQAKRLLDKYSPWSEHSGTHFLGYNHKTCHGHGYWKIVPGTLKFTSDVNEFKPFTVTPLISEAIEKGKKPSANEIVSSLTDVVSLLGNSNNTNTYQPPNNTTNNGSTNTNFPNQPANGSKQAGFPLFIGGAIVVVGAMYLYQQSKNKKQKIKMYKIAKNK